MKKQSITRREFIQGGLASGAALASPSLQHAAAKGKADAAERPNVLVVFSDQQHWRALGFLDPFFDTPNLDALAAESLVFENSFCTTPQCSPSRSSLLTGFYPSKTGVWGNVGAAGGKALERETIGAELQAAGYRTGYFGKWHLGERPAATKGWDESFRKINDRKNESSAVEFLRNSAASDKPFALFVSFNNPHDIYKFERHTVAPDAGAIPLPPSWERERLDDKPSVQKQFMTEDQGKVIWGKGRKTYQQYRDCYRSKNNLYDANAGAVLSELKKQGLWDNTIIVVTSDHGDMDANHKLIYKGPFMYEHMVRIPLMIRVPKKFGGAGAGREADLDVVNVDIAPTVREFCGLPDVACDGLSLKPVLTGSSGQKKRDFVIGEYYSKQKWVNPIRMIRTHDFKYNRYIHYGEELYDLKNDPHEVRNLAADPKFAKEKKKLSEELDRWMKKNNDTFPSQKTTDRMGNAIA